MKDYLCETKLKVIKSENIKLVKYFYDYYIDDITQNITTPSGNYIYEWILSKYNSEEQNITKLTVYLNIFR